MRRQAKDLIEDPRVLERLRRSPDVTGRQLEVLLNWRAWKIRDAVRSGLGQSVVQDIYKVGEEPPG